LKKAALAAGVVAWTTPVVQVVSSRTAHAQTITGCSPVATITVRATGENCECAPGPPNQCCSATTWLVDSLTVNCGPTCAGAAEVAGLVEFPGISKPSACGEFPIYEFPCSGGTASFPARFPVRCADGQIYLFDGTVNAVCKPCLLEDAPPQIVQQGGLDDESATTTTEAWTGTTAEALPTATTEAMVPTTSDAPTTSGPDARVSPAP
jgi:hypothetical protein